MTILEKFNTTLVEVNTKKNTTELYEYLVKNCGPSCPTIRTYENLLPGCISKTYLSGIMKDGKMYFEITGESKVVQGMGQLLCHLFSNQTPEEIVNFQFSNLLQLNYTQWLESARQNGFKQMFIRIRQLAEKHKNKQ